MELNRLFVAWVETEYHRRVHTETGQPPLDRWEAGWDRLGHTPAIPTADDLTEAFLWSSTAWWPRLPPCRCTPTPTRSILRWSGARSSWCSPRLTWKPSRSATATSHMGKPCRTSSPAMRTRKPGPRTLSLSRRRRGSTIWRRRAAAHHEQLRGDERIGYHALYGSSEDGEIPGQLSIDDVQPCVDDDPESEVSA
ncbi:putative tRANSPOSASE [Mycobacterium xenopi 3993]|nr:putative tRANSPOSASE [Mycobacterium xenopi 3993]